MRISDYIAEFLTSKGVDMVFAITGAGDIRLIESINQAGINYICPHHEQAGVMASLTRTRLSGKPAVCVVTGGPGATNTLIAVADAFLDSIPCVILAGQENLEYVHPHNEMRGKGVQGLDMPNIMHTVTKYAACITNPNDVKKILEKAWHEAYSGRPGPVWIDIPQNLQWATIEPDTLEGYTPNINITNSIDMRNAAIRTIELIKSSQRPLLWAGHGIRLSNSQDKFRKLLDKLNVPALATWQAADLVPNDHTMFVGRAGTYGQRFGNLSLQNSDLLITLGTRLALPQRGFDDLGFARAAKKVIVEIDPVELNKFKFDIELPVLGNVSDFIDAMLEVINEQDAQFDFSNWKAKCDSWKIKYPMATAPVNPDAKGINSYWFIDRLSEHLSNNAIIVTDMGTSLTCTHAAIRLKDGQRIMTSTGLGEMGFGLPGAIGAALGSENKQIVFIGGEGSLMMNLQELQTLKHLNLPIKIFLLNNDGYLTIKHTHNALYKSNGNASATDKSTGVTFPDFSKLIPAFGLKHCKINTARNLDNWIKEVLATPECVFAEVVMPEFQELIPKSAIKKRVDGSIYSGDLEDLYPFLSEEELKKEMIIPLRNKGN